MRILFVSGSPRQGKNNDKATAYAEEKAKEKGAETDSFRLSEKEVSQCVACDHCQKRPCFIEDDFHEFAEKAEKADVLIISSPVYFGSVSSQLKALFDRSRYMRRQSVLKGKIGGAIACGKSRNGGQETTLGAIHNWMLIQGMLVAGDYSHYGAAVVGEFEEDSEGKEQIERMIKELLS